jgi:folate-binding protein YgfZ
MTDIANPWLQFLQQNGALLDANDPTQVAGFSATANLADGFVAPLTHLGLISASGEDAANFLHNQLTNDVEHLGSAEARLAGYCSPKGRLLATFLMWRTADVIVLELPRALQPAIQKRLQMFVLRAKVKLSDLGSERVILGLGGKAIEPLKGSFTQLPAAPYAAASSDAGTLLRVADADGLARYQWVTTVDTAQRLWPDITAHAPAAGPQAWRLTDIHAGVPLVTQATQEQFVPQMINFELIGGVNFKKGCYPGQEVVARSQYLGKLKRRMVRASVAQAAVAAGSEVFAAGDPEQPCGMIVNAENNAAGGSDLLVELKIGALEDGAIHLGAATGPTLHIEPLPYALPDAA